MKKVIKVSIGNVAFILEEDAHLLLNSYINSLNVHYSSTANGQEIIDGIEERIAELLIEKCGPDKIVSVQEAKEVIDILGNPEVIDRESGEDRNNNIPVRKKYYRDPSHRIFGGVCSGFGSYFNRDTILFRLIFVVSFIIFFFTNKGIGIGCGAVVALYIILWIVFPAARTYEERCAMKGQSPSFDSIEKNIRNTPSETPKFWSTLGNVIVRFLGFILLIFGFLGLVTFTVAIFGIELFGISVPYNSIDIVTYFTGSATSSILWVKIFSCIFILIPFIALLYWGILMLFRMKAPKWRPGLIMFLCWIASPIVLASIIIPNSSPYWNSENNRVSNPIQLTSDTLYVEFANIDQYKNKQIYVEATQWRYDLTYLDNSNKTNLKMISYPNIHINNDDADSTVRIVAGTQYFSKKMSLDEIKQLSTPEFYTFDGKTLTVTPLIYDKAHPIKEVDRKVTLCIPNSTVVIIKDPVYHEFTNRFRYSNIKWIKNNNYGRF